MRWLFYLPHRAWMWWWGIVWTVSEQNGISLGRAAPWVFEQAIGCQRKTVTR